MYIYQGNIYIANLFYEYNYMSEYIIIKFCVFKHNKCRAKFG